MFVNNRLMKAAEELHLPKTLKPEYGGGLKEFVQSEHECFENTDEPEHFFTTQERQWLVLHLLQTLRATTGDTLPGLKLIEGQAIGMLLHEKCVTTLHETFIFHMCICEMHVNVSKVIVFNLCFLIKMYNLWIRSVLFLIFVLLFIVIWYQTRLNASIYYSPC